MTELFAGTVSRSEKRANPYFFHSWVRENTGKSIIIPTVSVPSLHVFWEIHWPVKCSATILFQNTLYAAHLRADGRCLSTLFLNSMRAYLQNLMR